MTPVDNRVLKSASLPNSLHSLALEHGNVQSKSLPTSLHAEDLAPLESVVVGSHVHESTAEHPGDSVQYHFKPGYSVGLLHVLERLAEAILEGTLGQDAQTSDDAAWAKSILDTFSNRDLPVFKLSTTTKDPILRKTVDEHGDMVKGETMTERIDMAFTAIEENNHRYPKYLRDLRANLDVVRTPHEHIPSQPLSSIATNTRGQGIPTRDYRTKRIGVESGQKQQSYPRLHYCDHCIPTTFLLYVLFRHEHRRYFRHQEDGARFLGDMRYLYFHHRWAHGTLWFQRKHAYPDLWP